jgi:DNA-binding GntR family transcriptional regulator
MAATTILTAERGRRASSGTQSEQAYRQIRAMIVDLELPPASLVDEGALVEALGFGHTPVREALRRLAQDNLVVILPRRGTLVADINWSDLQKIFELRLDLETLACRLAAERASPRQIEAMQALFADNAAVIANGDNRELIVLDHQAHQQIAEAAHNEFLEETLDWLYSHVLRLWNVSLDKVTGLREALDEHRIIVEAIKRRDAEAAASVMRRHVIGFQEQFTAIR